MTAVAHLSTDCPQGKTQLASLTAEMPVTYQISPEGRGNTVGISGRNSYGLTSPFVAIEIATAF